MQAPAHADTAPQATLSASEREKAKTPIEKGQDVAYTINHSLMCLASDWLDPIVGNWTQKKLGNNISLGGFANVLSKGKVSASEKDDGAGHGLAWWIGEAIGDVGAVPVTIMMQRMFPGFMSGIKGFMEPPLKGLFTKAAHKQAIEWGAKNGLEASDEKVQQKEKELYQYEVDHLPQAFMWTASSIAMNITAQKLWFNKEASLPVLLIGKGLGTVTTAATLISARGFFPNQMHNADTWISKTIIAPVSQSVGSVFGIDPRSLKTPMQEELATQLNEQNRSYGK